MAELSQEELAYHMRASIRRLIREGGYLPGLNPAMKIDSLELLVGEFAFQGKMQHLANVFGNLVQPTVSMMDMSLYGGAAFFTAKDGAFYLQRAFDTAIWERTRRLLVEGKWTIFADEKQKQAYAQAMANPAYRAENALRNKGRSIDFFPADK